MSYLVINTKRHAAVKEPRVGEVTKFITIRGKPAVLPWKLNQYLNIWLPRPLARLLVWLRICETDKL